MLILLTSPKAFGDRSNTDFVDALRTSKAQGYPVAVPSNLSQRLDRLGPT
jgi:hypothetical protein